MDGDTVKDRLGILEPVTEDFLFSGCLALSTYTVVSRLYALFKYKPPPILLFHVSSCTG